MVEESEKLWSELEDWSATAFVDDKSKEKAHVFFMTDNGLAYFTNMERCTGSPVRAVAEE
jgi:hypothetical protein